MRLQRFWVYWIVLCCCANWECKGQPAIPIEKNTATAGHEKYVGLPVDSTLFYEKVKPLQRARDLASATLMAAQSWLGTPYVHGTLDRWDTEQLVINLRQLDCWTYIEVNLALALASRDSTPSLERFAFFLRHLRYRDGIIDGYGSRIHYFSGWLMNADSLGYVKDITRELGGIRLKKEITFMTDEPGIYPKLTDTIQKQKVFAAQKHISAHEWYYIPKNKVAAMEHNIKDGDIIILTSSLHALDVEHQGFAVHGADGRIHLMHASSYGKKVIIGSRTLSNYMERLPAMSGIMVARIGG